MGESSESKLRLNKSSHTKHRLKEHDATSTDKNENENTTTKHKTDISVEAQPKRSKCCPKCRKRREERLFGKHENRDSKSSRSRSPSWSSSSSESDWWRNFRGSRSPSIPIDPYRTSPSHLELRRITSARKLPVPYDRRWTSSDSDSDDSYYRYRRRKKRLRPRKK